MKGKLSYPDFLVYSVVRFSNSPDELKESETEKPKHLFLMILKVPIFVETEGFSPTEIESIVSLLEKEFYEILREKDMRKFKLTSGRLKVRSKKERTLSIINREKALEFLRKGV